MAIKQARDIERIDVNQDHECRYWSRRFNVTTEKLKCAISTVGALIDDVARELGKT